MRYLFIVFLCAIFFFFLQDSYAQKVQDVSGLWTLKFKGIETGCQEGAKNGPREGTFVFRVLQQADNISATWTDKATTNTLAGKVIGFTVSASVHGHYGENCRVLTEITAEIVGKNELAGRYSGREINCETCRWEGEFSVVIAR